MSLRSCGAPSTRGGGGGSRQRDENGRAGGSATTRRQDARLDVEGAAVIAQDLERHRQREAEPTCGGTTHEALSEHRARLLRESGAVVVDADDDLRVVDLLHA